MNKAMETYVSVINNGCDRNCDMCDLFLYDREECYFDFEKKWKAWAEEQHENFEKVLKECKGGI